MTFLSCEDFRDKDKPETSRIEGLNQPRSTKPTTSLKVRIADELGDDIAYLDEGILFEPSPGDLSVVSATFEPSEVSALTTFSWTVRPSHDLFAADTPSLTIEFPADFIVQDECTPPEGKTCAVSQVQNSITIYDIITEDFTGGETISFQIGAVKNPTTIAGGQDEFRITTFLHD